MLRIDAVKVNYGEDVTCPEPKSVFVCVEGVEPEEAERVDFIWRDCVDEAEARRKGEFYLRRVNSAAEGSGSHET